MKWISVKDRLPELPNWVIAVTNRREVLPATYDGFRWCDDVMDYFQDYNFVTHWMPLPSAPEDGERNKEMNKDMLDKPYIIISDKVPDCCAHCEYEFSEEKDYDIYNYYCLGQINRRPHQRSITPIPWDFPRYKKRMDSCPRISKKDYRELVLSESRKE